MSGTIGQWQLEKWQLTVTVKEQQSKWSNTLKAVTSKQEIPNTLYSISTSQPQGVLGIVVKAQLDKHRFRVGGTASSHVVSLPLAMAHRQILGTLAPTSFSSLGRGRNATRNYFQGPTIDCPLPCSCTPDGLSPKMTLPPLFQ
ncbi:hypothetical protein XELAEV_18004410mg [Xenopus laevis]|uniref:Uncharacterized protein n=1 Tax=Xenopus laevis TaxID=8355 RepID=A0A974GZX0_XENLA|nr:hypothetical protein XELAEV_18004410mg [Xenopus laevis]